MKKYLYLLMCLTVFAVGALAQSAQVVQVASTATSAAPTPGYSAGASAVTPATPTVQEGQVVGCFAGQLYRSKAIDVVAYNEKNGDAVLNLLRRMDDLTKKLATAQSGPQEAFSALLQNHDDVQQQLLAVVRATIDSAPHAKTDAKGKFKVVISDLSASGEVTLLAIDMQNEGDPTYTTKVIRPAAKALVTVWLAGDEKSCPNYK